MNALRANGISRWSVYIGALAVFAMVAIAACAVPSLPAARVDPMEVLREQ